MFDYARYVNFDLTVELNLDNIPNMSLVMDTLTEAYRRVTPDYLSAVPYDYGTTGLAYNRKYISDEEMKEKGASILIDEAYKDKIGGWSDWRTRIWYGALQTGQDPNNIEDMEAVWDAIRSHRDLALKYWSSGAELMSLLAEEEIYVTEGWSGRIAALQQEGHDIGYYDAPGSFAWQECLHGAQGQPGRGLRGASELHARARDLDRRGRGAELSARARRDQGRSGRQDPDPAGL